MDVVAFLIEAGRQAVGVLLESAPYALAGFFAAGLFRAFGPQKLLSAHLGGAGLWPVVKASLIGIPIPLCSCGVVPAAIGLRRAGAGRGAATSFLISTPETGADSIAVNYALLDPIMTVARPVAAIATAVATGWAVERYGGRGPLDLVRPAPEPAPVAACGCGGSCAVPDPALAAGPVGPWARFKSGMKYALDEIVADVGGWLLLGVVLAGVIGAAVPAEALSRHLGAGLASKLAMLALSAPVYVCATSSTPIVAALALKGLSPGAAMVFLLAGPASNIASVTVFARMFGTRAALVYLACIAVCALAAGYLVDGLYGLLGLDVSRWLTTSAAEEPGLWSAASAVVLVALIVRARLPRHAH